MKAWHAPRTHYNTCTTFYTSTRTRSRNLTEACATIGDWASIYTHIPYTVLLLETWAIVRENMVLVLCRGLAHASVPYLVAMTVQAVEYLH